MSYHGLSFWVPAKPGRPDPKDDQAKIREAANWGRKTHVPGNPRDTARLIILWCLKAGRGLALFVGDETVW